MSERIGYSIFMRDNADCCVTTLCSFWMEASECWKTLLLLLSLRLRSELEIKPLGFSFNLKADAKTDLLFYLFVKGPLPKIKPVLLTLFLVLLGLLKFSELSKLVSFVLRPVDLL
jgi:hypothetical protein